MTTHTGYFLIADISGYTEFLTSSELEHANPILQSLLSSLVEQIGEPLNLWRMEGDAVLAYSTREAFPTGETFLAICENLYNAFASLQQNMVANTTCPCRACANVGNLDLKILVHHGTFEEMKIGPMSDISGADVILVHRMAKTDVREATGIGSYALFSDAAVAAMNIDAALVPYSQNFDHFGDVAMQVYDLARAWEKFRAGRERLFLEEADGVYTYRHRLALPRQVVWDALVSPEFKVTWMNMLSVDAGRPEGRIGPGSVYHCAHEAFDFFYTVVDWEPFDYFSNSSGVPFGDESMSMPETYALTDTEDGTEIRYTMGWVTDESGQRHEDMEAQFIALFTEFWPVAFGAMDEVVRSRS